MTDLSPAVHQVTVEHDKPVACSCGWKAEHLTILKAAIVWGWFGRHLSEDVILWGNVFITTEIDQPPPD